VQPLYTHVEQIAHMQESPLVRQSAHHKCQAVAFLNHFVSLIHFTEPKMFYFTSAFAKLAYCHKFGSSTIVQPLLCANIFQLHSSIHRSFKRRHTLVEKATIVQKSKIGRFIGGQRKVPKWPSAPDAPCNWHFEIVNTIIQSCMSLCTQNLSRCFSIINN
jgi:hypothetical protein